MARLFGGEKASKSVDVMRLLRAHDNGLRESEVAEMLGWERRTANNYLRDLEAQERAYKEGRLWHAEE
jgi:DNA-binding IclR family transcriptional regulator